MIVRRALFFLLASVGPLATAACASLAGLSDVPNVVDGGVRDSTVDGARRDARGAFDAAFDVRSEAARDASVDRSLDARVATDTGTETAPGCQAATDCPVHQACNPATGQCSVLCSSANACNGGCCSGVDAGACFPGDAAAACGNGTVCSTCSSPTPLCSNGDCTGACNGSACGAGSCCTNAGCQPGGTQTSCGSEAACVNCTNSGRGHACVGSKCGCLNETDCSGNNACVAGVCTGRCKVDGGTASQCNNGCCDSSGYCIAGTLPSSCGRGELECFSCGGQNGSACLDGGSCGCLTELNCSPAYTCANEACTKACDGSVSSLCHDGCCSAGQCTLGESSNACGRAVSGGNCADCTLTCSPGPTCNPVPDGGGAFSCSCRDNGGCSAGASCTTRKICMGARFAFDGGPITQLGSCIP